MNTILVALHGQQAGEKAETVPWLLCWPWACSCYWLTKIQGDLGGKNKSLAPFPLNLCSIFLKESWGQYQTPGQQRPSAPQERPAEYSFEKSTLHKPPPEYSKITSQVNQPSPLSRKMVKLLLTYICLPCTWPLYSRYEFRIIQETF